MGAGDTMSTPRCVVWDEPWGDGEVSFRCATSIDEATKIGRSICTRKGFVVTDEEAVGEFLLVNYAWIEETDED